MTDSCLQQVEHDVTALASFLDSPPLIMVISGPSGVGKDSVVECLRGLGHPFHFVVTTTDRPRREGEVNGRDYNFVSTAEFERMIADDELFEHAMVYGQHKGVPKARAREALEVGLDVVMRLDVQGALTIKRLVPQAVTVMLVPPSVEALTRRLRQRGGDSDPQLEERLYAAMQELAQLDQFDYAVMNADGKLTEAAQTIAAIISAERCRVGRQSAKF